MKIIKNPKRLVLKLFILVWVFLALQIVLKVTFNYWQPYVIPTPQLEAISQFIDNNYWIRVIIDKSLYVVNAFLMLLASTQQWWFKKKYPIILVCIGAVLSFVDDFTPYNTLIDSILTFVLAIGLPLLMDVKKWWATAITFALTNVFMFLSLWLEGFSYDGQMSYVTSLLLNNDYYIMLVLNYMLLNLIKKEVNHNG